MTETKRKNSAASLARHGVCAEGGVIVIALLSVFKLVLDGIYAILPDWDLESQVAAFNVTTDIGTVHYEDTSPWGVVMHFMGRFNVFFPVREAIQLIGFYALVWGLIWGYFFLWKFIKTLRGSG